VNALAARACTARPRSCRPRHGHDVRLRRADGAFVGGAIAPGIELGLDALASRTAKLPRVELRTPDRAIGRDTVAAIQSGAVLGYQDLVARTARRDPARARRRGGRRRGDVHVVLTGGLSQAPWAGALEGVEAIDPT
jgi:pantothenate kinase type III